MLESPISLYEILMSKLRIKFSQQIPIHPINSKWEPNFVLCIDCIKDLTEEEQKKILALYAKQDLSKYPPYILSYTK
jgi:hypothetical protein